MNSELKNKIMKRVYLIWFVRYLVKDVLVKAAGLGILIWGLKQAVFVSEVLKNVSLASREFGALLSFSLNALENAGPYVLFLFFGAGVVTGFLLRDIAYLGSRFLMFFGMNAAKRRIAA